ncbi:MAG: hypothetical protein NEA02_18845 [Thermoanaerobaculia bacterium]|nr:hypothetical protein [Thermoanaerobaculia bacterium]
MRQTHSLLSLLAALASLLGPAASAGQTTADNFAIPDISEHSPAAAAIRRSNSNELRLFAVSKQGLSERHFLRVPGKPDDGWFSWKHEGKPDPMAQDPAKWCRFLPMTSGWGSAGPDVFGFFGFPGVSGDEKIGIAHLTSRNIASPPYALDFQWEAAQNPPGGIFPELFNPRTVVSNDTSLEFDVFGTNSDDGRPSAHGNTPLLRLHGHKSGPATWSFTAQNLGQPRINGSSANVSLGPQSTATAILGQSVGPAVVRHFVVAKASLPAEDRVTFATGDLVGGPFTWGIDLGLPRVGQMVDAPLVVAYDWKDCSSCQANFKRITVWITMFDRDAARHTLWERHFDAKANVPSDPRQIAQWSPWQTFGSPAGLDPRTPFRLTSGLVWFQGSTMRINMFGYTDGDAAGPERIVEFYWPGNAWFWGNPSLRTPPSGAGVRTLSASVLQSAVPNPAYTRLSVFARTGGTSNPGTTDVGHVWELYDVIENGKDSGWRWLDLSFECVTNAPCSIPVDTR